MMLRFTKGLLITLDVALWISVLFFAVMLVRFAFADPYAAVHAALPGHGDEMRKLMIAMFVIGIATGVAVDLIFRRLIAILDTVREERPFAGANGDRLRAIGWALLVVQILDLALGWYFAAVERIAVHPPFLRSPSITGWLTVLLLFVLAQVFARGAALQDDLEGTV